MEVWFAEWEAMFKDKLDMLLFYGRRDNSNMERHQYMLPPRKLKGGRNLWHISELCGIFHSACVLVGVLLEESVYILSVRSLEAINLELISPTT